jgi:hypothetical protein
MRLTSAEKYRNELEQWRQEVASLLDFDFPSARPTPQHSLFVRKQSLALKLTFYHVMILIHRPFLLDTFSEIPSERLKMKEHTQVCLDASMAICKIVGRLQERDRCFQALWVSLFIILKSESSAKSCKFGHYCAYSAIVCLYVYVIRTYEKSPDIWTQYLEAAQICQQQIDISARKESFAQRCSGVLKELEVETLDCIHRRDVFAQSASISNGLDGIQSFKRNTMIEKIDQWGFSSLTGY